VVGVALDGELEAASSDGARACSGGVVLRLVDRRQQRSRAPRARLTTSTDLDSRMNG
jgi:hypothetical protein